MLRIPLGIVIGAILKSISSVCVCVFFVDISVQISIICYIILSCDSSSSVVAYNNIIDISNKNIVDILGSMGLEWTA